MEAHPPITILIAVTPGVMRSSVFSYVQSIRGVRCIGLAGQCEMACELVEQFHPDVLLLDIDLIPVLPNVSGSLAGWLQVLRARGIDTRIILLVNTLREIETARLAGAGAAFLKGMLDDGNLRQAIQQPTPRMRP